MANEIDIKSTRQRLGWTQERLAAFLGVDRSSVSRMENDGRVQGPVVRLVTILVAAIDRGEVHTLLEKSAIEVRESAQ